MKRIEKSQLKQITLTAMLTAFICVTGVTSFPTPAGVPLTLQTLSISLCGFLLGAKWGIAATATYILIGAIGLPVFSGFSGGFQHLLGLQGGFIIGFLALSLFCGFSNKFSKKLIKIAFGGVGVICCHLVGVLQLSFISQTPFLSAFLIGSLPFLLKDFACVIIALYLSEFLKRNLK